MTDIVQVIETIEHGLLKPKGKSNRPRNKMELDERMAYYGVVINLQRSTKMISFSASKA